MKETILKADLHVHSRHSTRPSQWFLRKIGCSESYTDPLEIYAIAKNCGMDLVTITDHNTITGSLEIAHLDNTFVSEEITTCFPEDNCKLHVLVYGITEAQHNDITVLRKSVFELVSYLNQEKIVHVLAHPMFSISSHFAVKHFEKTLLLFKNFELNGSRNHQQNCTLKEILDGLTREDIDHLANRYDLAPVGPMPWVKNLVGGSDDHSSLTIAETYTEMEGVASVEEFLAGIDQGRGRMRGRKPTPKTMAHNLYSIAYQFYKTRFPLERYFKKELLLRFAEGALMPADGKKEGFIANLRNFRGYRRPKHLFDSTPKTIQEFIGKEARDIVLGDPQMSDLLTRGKPKRREIEEVWYRFANRISERIFQRSADDILKNLSDVNLFDIIQPIGSAGSLYTMLSPYFISYSMFRADLKFSRDCFNHLCGKRGSQTDPLLSVAHFTDTFYEINGVARTLQMQLKVARRDGRHLEIITCDPGPACCPDLSTVQAQAGRRKDMQEGVTERQSTDKSESLSATNFPPVGTFELPEYPEIKLYYPPLLEMLDYCYEKNFTHIHSATPGPIGLAALAIARILKLPLHGTYHTALPEYTSQLTGDSFMAELMWKYMVWYYNQMDVVHVPSHSTGKRLVQKGIHSEKIRFQPRGVDTECFHPSKRNGFFRSRFMAEDNILYLLYVGRISKEKDIPLLTDVYRELQKLRPKLHLAVVGDGPYLEEMRTSLDGLPVTFTGYLTGQDLAQAYASSDIFIFPSTTDTFGNVVLEAQASGLPVIVSDQGGPKENLVPDETGFIIPAGETSAFVTAVLKLADNPGRLQRMGRSARGYTETRHVDALHLSLWESYRNSMVEQ